MKFKVRRFKEISSTNTLAKEYADGGAPEGLVLVADHQTHGRGKPGRKWISPPGKNLLFSLIVRPLIRPNQAPLITQIVCRSVAAVLKKHGVPSTFKRPNDVMVNGKKICGVLVESASGTNGHLESAVIGIGLNVNADSEELIPEAVSMKTFKGREYHRPTVLKEILNQLKHDLKGLYARPA